MKLFKCEDCGLIMSEFLGYCPKCNSEKNMLSVNLGDNDDVYTITMDDVDEVMASYDERKRAYIESNYSREQLLSIFRNKLEIEWTEYVEAVIDCRLLEGYSVSEKTKGYGIHEACGSEFYIPGALHIEKIDDMGVFKDDDEACKQAELDGIELIYNMEGVPDGVYLDTIENRSIIVKALEKQPEYKKWGKQKN